TAPAAAPVTAAAGGEPVNAPLAGNIFKVHVKPGEQIQQGDVIVILEAMKMETEIRAPKAGLVQDVYVKEGDSVTVGEALITIA
ncbi:MAG TPA: biotin/lipoyl-containing protein, partial [Pseudomonadales bacterium]